MVKEPRKIWALRLTEAEKDDIKDRADKHGLSMSRYMVRAARGELDDPSTLAQELEHVKRRLDRLEDMAGF